MSNINTQRAAHQAATSRSQRHDPTADAPCSVVPEKREVIQDQLLTELNDKGKVAILATKADLDLFIEAMQCLNSSESDRFLADLRQLRKAAFE